MEHGNKHLSTATVDAGAVVLASASAIRAAMLRAAGVAIVVAPVAVDESAVKQSLRSSGAAVREAADALAELKALRGSARQPDALVIGADQILECDGAWFDKPVDMEHARAHLQALRGKTHRLVTAACVARQGRVVWRQVQTAQLAMRPFSDAFLDDYLARVGDAALTSVGAYQVETLGAQLFSRIEGDHFVILGLPLLGLLDHLRVQGVLLA